MRSRRNPQSSLVSIATHVMTCTLLVLAGCQSDSGERIKVNTGVGPGVAFGERGDTYVWVPEATNDKHDPWNDVPSVHKLFRELVDRELSTKGYRRQASGAPAYKLDDRLVHRTVGNPSDPGVDRRINTVALYVLNPENESTIWTAQAEVEFRERAQSSAEIRERLERVVKQMLEPIKPRTR